MQASRIWVVVACLLMPLVADAERGDVAPRPPDWRGARVKPCRRVEFEGLVTAGHSYRKSIGGGLDFVLDAVPHGWIVRVLPTSGDRPEQDFAEVATPPFRSINPLLLTTDFGFRAQDVVGWNPRTFHYVGTAASFAAAQRAYRATLSSRVPTREQEMAVTQVVMGALEGRLEVVDAALTPGRQINRHQPPWCPAISRRRRTPSERRRAEKPGRSARCCLSGFACG